MFKNFRSRVSVLGPALLGAVAAAPAAAQQMQPYYGYGPYMGHGGWHGWLFGPLMMILFVAVIVVVVVLLVRWIGGAGRGVPPYHPPGRTALDILKERFARGEIDKEEFEERRRVLGE